MSAADPFFDTNVLLYLLSTDTRKADRVESLLAENGTISVQVLNEFAAVARRKIKMPLEEIREILDTVRSICAVEPITLATHDQGLEIHAHYGFSIYDSMLVAAALIAQTSILYSEDFRHGQVLDGRLRVVNPFRPS